MNVIIFSRDRAMQLDALLQSIDKNAPILFSQNLQALIKTTHVAYMNGYRRLAYEWPNLDTTFRFRDLKYHLLNAVDPKQEFTMLLVDDAVFYRQLPPWDILPGVIYAPRLGKNCTMCYNAGGVPQAEGELDFKTIVSIDGHVYRTSELLPKLQGIEITVPNDIEARVPADGWKLRYADHSCLVGIPYNRVCEGYGSREMVGGNSAWDLNRWYLSGQRIDIDKMDFSDVRSCHQDIPYVFKQI
jgi:hypothetical protein